MTTKFESNSKSPNRKEQIAWWGTILIGAGLLGIGLLTFFDPETSSKNYGIPASGRFDGWVMATGTRDIILGLFLFLIAGESKFRTWTLAFLLLAPIADVILSASYGFMPISNEATLIGTKPENRTWEVYQSLFLHSSGALAIGFVWFFSLTSKPTNYSE